MKITNLAAFAVCLGASLSASGLMAEDAVFEDVIRVTGVREPLTEAVVRPATATTAPTDLGALVGRLAGAALVNNGPLSGQVQYRGMFGTRVGVTINGQRFHSGGPNMMDPPLHYAPLVLVDHVEVSRGSPDLSMPAALIGGLNAELKQVPFGAGGWHYDIGMVGRGLDDSHAVGGVAGISSEDWRAFVLFSDESGDNQSYPGGEIASTLFERRVYGFVTGLRRDNSTLELEIRRQETGPTGNPPFAMDIEFVDTDFARVSFDTSVGDVRLHGSVGYTDVDHGMNNFGLRPPPGMVTMYRRTLTGAQTWVAALAGDLRLGEGHLAAGVDTERADKSALITNPNNPAFFLASLPDITMQRTGTWVQWRPATTRLQLELGGRLDRHTASAGTATTGAAVPMMPAGLATAFNSIDRNWDDTTADLLARVWASRGNTTFRASLARKHRAPGYVERFAWLPTEASAGLADGNTYVGQTDLATEAATTLDLGFDYAVERGFVRATLFVSRIDNYIQGTPFDATPGVIDSSVEMVSSMNGDPTPLQFRNVDARLTGIETDFGLSLGEQFDVDGNYTLVQGERRDIGDNLYRITPPRLMLGLNWHHATLGARIEGIWHGAQRRVSLENGEQPGERYTLVNLQGDWQPQPGFQVSLGVQNLLDRNYREHLAGYNRVAGGDVPVGERVPGGGRNLYLRLQLRR
ncbi:MAG: TonB-dependent receptor [Pseudomonadota bacterium]